MIVMGLYLGQDMHHASLAERRVYKRRHRKAARRAARAEVLDQALRDAAWAEEEDAERREADEA